MGTRLSRTSDDREITLWIAQGPRALRDARKIECDILARSLNVPAERVRIERTCPNCGGADHGKPALVYPSGAFFSTSHSGNLVGVAVARQGPIGFDVERVVARSNDVVIGELAVEERAALSAVPDDRRNGALLQLWTRKEAALKATGLGLSLALSSFAVTAPGGIAAITRAAPGWPEMTSWTVIDVAPADGFVGAIVHGGPSVPVRRVAWPTGI